MLVQKSENLDNGTLDIKIKRCRGQAVLDFILVFLAIALLAVGITRIWVWFNANYASRTVAYQRSRLTAGQPHPTYTSPFDIGADEPAGEYVPLDLTEEWVFKGNASDQPAIQPFGGGPPPDIGDYESECESNCSSCRSGEIFNYDCRCYVRCICEAMVEMKRPMYEAQSEALRDSARSMRDSADGLRDAAEQCDDPWELCWWGDWGATPGELRDAANKLDREAAILEAQANALDTEFARMSDCCRTEATFELMEICFDFIEDIPCEDIVDGLTDNLNGIISDAQDRVTDLQTAYNEVDVIVPWCNSEAFSSCEQDCIDFANQSGSWIQEDYDTCMSDTFSTCYEERRNTCCNEECCAGGEWGRDCDAPTSGCDDDCLGPPDENGYREQIIDPCPDCGLEEFRDRIPDSIMELQDTIIDLQQKVLNLPNCCTLPDDQQRDCITNIMTN